MSTSDPSAFEVNVVEFIQMKEHMAEMMRMMQQLVVRRNREPFGPIPKGSVPYSKNENQPLPNPNQGHTTLPFTP